MTMHWRRAFTAGGISAILLLAGCGAPEGPGAAQVPAGEVPDRPSQPVTLNILDVAGNLQLTQGMIDDFVAKNPDIVSRVTTEKAAAPEMAGKIKAQQDAGRLGIDLVLTGTDGLSAGTEQGLFTPLLPQFADRLKGMENYQEPAAAMQELAVDHGVVITYYPSGPLIEYAPDRVPNPPKTAQELLAYAQANPGKVGYARPANSGPGRTFLMGLPYILGDSNPKDPVNGWEKTWAYLAELDKTVTSYPSGTADTMKNLANGTYDIIVSTTGWDINPRALGTVPAEYRVGTLEGFTWVTDAHYAAIPKGVSADKQAALLALIEFMLTPEQQAKAYDTGYFYPGPAVEGVTLDMAPPESQQVIRQFGRPEYDALIANNPKATPLATKDIVAAFDRWDREIGGGNQ
ncbi:putative spermidine/putrescine transport system substrate-binding protein [Pseudonocardia hierapolitana]|uniref:Putative spermidine/putrescine transport system substrate-binding protein n=1 Tax=Pseudonocardia hierapolitana TaxID=1128676 RepID=A0A561SXU8_9PSEU|nr:extracellular solute-binding protein [Pseudonocardia hierapolitana]TWF79684.1 putative spermidine/putrescine transport system substrate-binding protein [Pseudonocardia hierapolitana]